MANNHRNDNITPLAGDLERAEKLREAIGELIEANRDVPVIVEGRRDAAALRELGVEGEIIVFNRGSGIYDFCEDISESLGKVILLMDWDGEGDRLQAKIGEGLRGMWEEYAPLRRALRSLCQKDVKDIESIPTLLARLESGMEGAL